MATETAKEEIHRAIEDLPPEDLAELVRFLDYLKFKAAQDRSAEGKRIVKLGGLWKDLPFDITEEDIREARREMWGEFGERDV